MTDLRPTEIAIGPGVYFDMPEEVYHAAPALSASGIKNLLISPLDYWIASSLNPAYVDVKTDEMATGTAFHRRLLEPERFASLYAAQPTKEDYPDAIDGAESLRAECERLGLKKGGRIADMCDRILDADPRAQLWPVIREMALADLGDRVLLKPAALADIERMAGIVLAHQSARMALSGGYPEVSIFWTDPEYGVPMKSRLDYLKVKAVVDIKSFNNSLGRPIDAAVAHATVSQRHHVQAAVYADAVEHAKAMLRQGKSAAIHGGDDIPNDWFVNLAACRQHTFVFVFIEQGPVTNVRVREFRRHETYAGMGGTTNAYWQAAHDGYRLGVRRYAECMERFGPDKPWIEDVPAKPFTDQDFPLWALN